MTLPHPVPVRDIAARINADIIGDADQLVYGINEIHKVRAGDLMFVDVAKYFDKALTSAATIIIMNEAVPCPDGKTLLICDQPFEAYNALVKQYRPFESLRTAVHHEAVIHPTAIIEPQVVIGHHVSIGAHTYIAANTVIAPFTLIGQNVIIQQNCTIGSDAFYFKKTKEGYLPWHSGGRVLIEDSVQIGAGCTIAKGVSGDTIIGQGSKLDCQVHIGHGVVVGKQCLLAAQVGIGGKTILGDRVVIYGQVGLAQNIHIGDDVTILGKSGVTKDVPAGKTIFGYPATEAREQYKHLATLRRLGYKKE